MSLIVIIIAPRHHQFLMMDGTRTVVISIVMIIVPCPRHHHQFLMMDGTVVMISIPILMATAINGRKNLIVRAPIAMDVIAGGDVRIIIGIQVTGFVSEKVALSTIRLLITLVGKWFAMTRVTHVVVWNREEGDRFRDRA
ncbi:membrane protein [Candidatus Thiomargarita nelsonii]|uniref:Membrane protein n=1 Tax=Candidatus Thiomargarita nelsonii TaxID=1003181 RepID=A0A176S3L0_9GAMM|nr:membrane protein [Candidatus Thiomargarita nelsonii]